MSSAQDPFYIVKEKIQYSIDKLQSSFHKWERIPANSQVQQQLTKQLFVSCESIEWQEKIIDHLGMEMESTSNRLDFVQKKVEMVMKKAGKKGQFMMILFLVVLFIVLFVLGFLT